MNNTALVTGIATLLLAGGAAAFAYVQSLRNDTPQPAIVSTGIEAREANEGLSMPDHDDDGPGMDDGPDEGPDDEGEVSITLADLPEAVRSALADVSPENAVTRVTRESEAGATTYEVEYTKDGGTWAAEFAPDGAVLEIEEAD